MADRDQVANLCKRQEQVDGALAYLSLCMRHCVTAERDEHARSCSRKAF